MTAFTIVAAVWLLPSALIGLWIAADTWLARRADVNATRAAMRAEVVAHIADAPVAPVEWDWSTFLALTTDPGWLDTLADIDELPGTERSAS